MDNSLVQKAGTLCIYFQRLSRDNLKKTQTTQNQNHHTLSEDQNRRKVCPRFLQRWSQSSCFQKQEVTNGSLVFLLRKAGNRDSDLYYQASSPCSLVLFTRLTSENYFIDSVLGDLPHCHFNQIYVPKGTYAVINQNTKKPIISEKKLS